LRSANFLSLSPALFGAAIGIRARSGWLLNLTRIIVRSDLIRLLILKQARGNTEKECRDRANCVAAKLEADRSRDGCEADGKEPEGIVEVDRIPTRIPILIDSAGQPDRVALREGTQLSAD